MNAPEKITSAEPINAAHEVLMKAADAMCTQQIASEIHGRPRPTKPQMKAVDKWLKELHACGMLTSQPGRGGVALYSLITPVCDLVQTDGKSQTAAFAERILTPEAEAEREDFEARYGMLGNCSCHISPPCGSCMHPGNPRNQEEDETAWMAAGDSEGGETDSPVTFLAPEDYEMPPADPALLASANRMLSDRLEGVAHALRGCGLPALADISGAEDLQMATAALSGAYRMAQVDADSARAELQADSTPVLRNTITELEATVALQSETLVTAAADFSRLSSEVATARQGARAALAQADDLRTRLAAALEIGHVWEREMKAAAGVDSPAEVTAVIEGLRAGLAIERQAREAQQEKGNATDVTAAAVGYLVRVPMRPPIIRRKLEAARLAALGAVRAGASRAEVLAVVSVGVARRGAEWQSTEAGG